MDFNRLNSDFFSLEIRMKLHKAKRVKKQLTKFSSLYWWFWCITHVFEFSNKSIELNSHSLVTKSCRLLWQSLWPSLNLKSIALSGYNSFVTKIWNVDTLHIVGVVWFRIRVSGELSWCGVLKGGVYLELELIHGIIMYLQTRERESSREDWYTESFVRSDETGSGLARECNSRTLVRTLVVE
jgi:hypothetical protein